ncbi:MAG: hypothetical protein JWM16_5240 [Verrucomicrobiales bacterium]|nr:hypothetical protein [Verrucomicrobiales bacterium]
MWRSLEAVHGFSAVGTLWRLELGVEFEPLAANFLRKRTTAASSFPCAVGCGCMHLVVPGGEVAVCQCEPPCCNDITVSPKELVVWELDVVKLGRALSWAFGCEPLHLRLLIPHTVQIGAFSSSATPLFLTTAQGRDEFQETITGLVADSKGPAFLVGWTMRYVDSRCKELLDRAKIQYLDLESYVKIESDGKLVASRPAQEVFERALQVQALPRDDGQHFRVPESVPPQEKILSQGKLRYCPGFNDVWLDDQHFDLRERKKARLCIQYLVENSAFDAGSARHLIDEIDPHVRKVGDFLPSVEIKIDHYFTDKTGRLQKLRKGLIQAAGRNGRFFLKVK